MKFPSLKLSRPTFKLKRDKSEPQGATTRTRKTKSRGLVKYLKDTLGSKETRNRILFTLLILAIYRILGNIPLPGIDMHVYQQQFGSASTSEAAFLLSSITGGRLETPSIIGLGVGVYITASIIMQLMSSVIPRLEELGKEGVRGKQIIDQYTRYLTVPLSVIYSVGYLMILAQQNLSGDTANPVYMIPRSADGGISAMRIAFMAAVLTAGSLLLMWLAELVTERGIGNGASVIIMVGILASLPNLITRDLSNIRLDAALLQLANGDISALKDPSIITLFIILIGLIVLVAGVVFMTESTRKLPILYARRQRDGDVTGSFLPIKLNQSGVLPIIFAASLLTVPQLLIPILLRVVASDSSFHSFLTGLQTSPVFTTNTAQHNSVYFVLIIILSLLYATIALKPADVAENLQKSGAIIPGVRPGQGTENYITKVLLRLTAVGAIFIAVIALIPSLAGGAITSFTGQTFYLFTGVGGTSILIVVGVILDTLRQLDSLRATQNYEEFI
jgi:preprotein translocase subunit SecY